MINQFDRNRQKIVVLDSKSKLQWLTLKAGLLYFAIVFAVGFLLGTIRVLWIVPYTGTRVAELMEMPLMFIAIVMTANWLVQRLSIPPLFWIRLGMGFVALLCLLGAEFGPVLYLRGLSMADYLSTRDPLSGAVYSWMLGIFTVMPWLIALRKPRSV